MIGIDISDRSIKVAEITHHKNERSLKTVCWSPLHPNMIRRGVIQDVPAVTTALQEAFTKCSPVPISDRVVVASIPEVQSFVRVLDLPEMDDSEVEEAVQWAVRQHIPFELDHVYLDWQPLQETTIVGQRRQVLVGAVQRDVVDPLLQVLDNAGLHVLALELEAQSVVRSLLPLDSQDIQGVLILDIGATSTNIVFFDQGHMRFTASVQMGGDNLTQQLAQSLHIQPSVAAEKKAQVGLQGGSSNDTEISVALHEATVELLKRVEKVVREMSIQLQNSNAVRAILLSGGSANLPGIRNTVAEVFPNIPIQMGNPWINIFQDERMAPLSPQDASHFVTALGLALRHDQDYAYYS